MLPGSGDRDAGRVGIDFHDLIAIGKVAGDSRVNLDIASQAGIKREM